MNISFADLKEYVDKPKYFKSQNPKCRLNKKGILPLIANSIGTRLDDRQLHYSLPVQALSTLKEIDDIDKLDSLISRCKEFYLQE